MSESADAVTHLLKRWRQGDENALSEMLPLLYDDLKRIAGRLFVGESAGHTLQPTAVVNEALLRIYDAAISWEDRCHFLAVMTTSMRRVLVDHARARASQKRGGAELRVTLATDLAGTTPHTDLLDLDAALTQLAERDARKAQIVELHYFGGLKYAEIAEVVSLSEASVHRELRFSKAWLRARLEGEAAGD